MGNDYEIGKWLKKFKISNWIVKQLKIWIWLETANAKLKNGFGNEELTIWKLENDYGNGEIVNWEWYTEN